MSGIFGMRENKLHKAIFTPHRCTSIELDATARFAQKQHNNCLNSLKEDREALIKRCEERRRNS